MPSIVLTKAQGPLDLENDQRDWFSEFREESAYRKESSRRKPQTLFAVVQHGRPTPIVITGVPGAAQFSQPSAHHRRSLLGRVKRAVSPTLTALFVLYVVVIFLTGWIGFRGSEAARRSDLAVQASPTDTWRSSNVP